MQILQEKLSAPLLPRRIVLRFGRVSTFGKT